MSSEEAKEDQLVFYCNGKKVEDKNVDPEVTLIEYIRRKLRLTGSKLGCSEGGCGACTVMVSNYDASTKSIKHMAVNACLAPVCSVHGMAVTTVEGIGSTKTKLHPVQERIAKAHGSQCGFCTPGIVVSMYTLLRNNPQPSMQDISSAFEGNLCRCTGYRPILEGYKTFAKGGCCGGSSNENGCCKDNNTSKETNGISTDLFQTSDFIPYDSSQEPIFPPELMVTSENQPKSVTFVGERLTWHRPSTLKQLIEMKANNPSAKLVVGNTEIGVEVKFKNQLYPELIAVTHIPELLQTEKTENGVTIGASVTLTCLREFLTSCIKNEPGYKTRAFAAIVEMLRWFAGHQIRNVAAVGGNIVTGSPISDLNPLFMAVGCTLELASQSGRREILMDHTFFTGYRRTKIKDDDILVSIHIPYSSQDEYLFGYKQSPRREDDIAIVNAGMKVGFEPGTDVIQQCRLAFGGMAATTILATKTARKIVGRNWDDNVLREVCASLADEIPLAPGAPGGMETYRQSLMLSFFFKFYLKVLNELKFVDSIATTVPASQVSAYSSMEHQMIHSVQIYQEVPPGQPQHDAVGRPNVHTSALQQATGEAIYCDDIPRTEDELYLAFVTSTKAHANIISVDVTEALAVPGVMAYVDHHDVPGDNHLGVVIHDEELFATKAVKCVGQIIGAIVAENQSTAQRAAKCVKIQYEELDAIITIQEAIAKQSFLRDPLVIQKGNIEEAFELSGHIFEGEVSLGGQEHFYLETQCCLATPKGEDKEMEIFITSQAPASIQESVANILGVPINRVICRVKRLGGGFGGKEARNFNIASSCAVAANKLGKPVRVSLDRDEDMIMMGTRHPYLGRYKVGYDSDGVIKALELDLFSNCGYSLDLSAGVMERAVLCSCNCYRIPNVLIRGHLCKTNLPSNTAFRGFGGPQGLFIAENWMSNIAVKCAISQIQAGALIHIYTDGSVLLTHGGVEMGQGLHTKMIQVASRYLRIPSNKIFISETSTNTVPNAQPTAASSSSDLNGMAIKEACEKLLRRLEPIIHANPKGSWEDWVHAAYIDRISLSATGFYRTPDIGFNWAKNEGMQFNYFSYGTAVSEVEIDCLTGDHQVIRTDIVMDVGDSLNPAIDIGQIEGAFIQGYGLFTLEDHRWSPKGHLLTRGPGFYKIPGFGDVPQEFNISLLSGAPNNRAVCSSKAIGEPPLFLAASVFFAIKDAIYSARREEGITGVFQLDSPATAERIRMACADQFTKQFKTPEPGTYVPFFVRP